MDGKTVAAACRKSVGLDEEVVLGLSLLPDETDVENLRLALLSGEVAKSGFELFCKENRLPPDLNDVWSACRFLVYTRGQPLAWLHFPETPEGLQMARDAHQWSEEQNLLVFGASEHPLSEITLSNLWPA